MPATLPTVGDKFGFWTVIWMGVPGYAVCLCDCAVSEPRRVSLFDLLVGKSTSCGCRVRINGKVVTRISIGAAHGMTKSSMYRRWTDMKQRCTNPNHDKYHRYGGRGITVCQRWLDSFEDYRTDVGDPPNDGDELDRKENDKGYEPGNVRWITHKENLRNRGCARMLTFNGKTQCLSAWCEELELDYEKVRGRLRQGLTDAEALTGVRVVPINKRVRANARTLVYRGVEKPFLDWCDELKLSRSLLRSKLQSGKSGDVAIDEILAKLS